jgi:beta-xylosidase
LIRNDVPWEGGVVEGPFIARRGDWFYMFYSGNGCCGAGCNYALGVARSKSLLGPWEKNPANPILAGNDQWKCPGHGSIITDPQGRYFLLYHAYARASSIFTGREALLDEVVFGTDGWPTINQGKGPSERAASPLGVAQRRAELSFEDEFDTQQLRPGWQWPQAHQPKVEFKGSQGGQLHLSPPSDRAADLIGAILARSTTLGDYKAVTVLSAAELKPGAAAGLAAFGDPGNAMGLILRDGKLVLWRRDKGKDRTLAEESAPVGNKLHLRLTTEKGYQFHFAFSANGKDWSPIGEDLEGKHLPPWDRSIRVALTAGGSAGAAGVFEKFELQPSASDR